MPLLQTPVRATVAYAGGCSPLFLSRPGAAMPGPRHCCPPTIMRRSCAMFLPPGNGPLLASSFATPAAPLPFLPVLFSQCALGSTGSTFVLMGWMGKDEPAEVAVPHTNTIWSNLNTHREIPGCGTFTPPPLRPIRGGTIC